MIWDAIPFAEGRFVGTPVQEAATERTPCSALFSRFTPWPFPSDHSDWINYVAPSTPVKCWFGQVSKAPRLFRSLGPPQPAAMQQVASGLTNPVFPSN